MVGQAVTERLATREVQQVAREFADLVSVEQLTGLAFVAVATASGVALAQQVVDLVVPRLPADLGVSRDPRRARDFLVAGLLEGAWALLVGMVAVKIIGAGRSFLFATAIGLSIGAVAIAGANLIEFGQRVFGMATAQLSDAGVDLPDVSGTRATSQSTAPNPADTAAGGQSPVATDGGLNVDTQDRHAEARALGQRAVAV